MACNCREQREFVLKQQDQRDAEEDSVGTPILMILSGAN